MQLKGCFCWWLHLDSFGFPISSLGLWSHLTRSIEFRNETKVTRWMDEMESAKVLYFLKLADSANPYGSK